MRSFAWLVFAVALALSWILPSLKIEQQHARTLQRADLAFDEHIKQNTQVGSQQGTVHSEISPWRFSTPELQYQINSMPPDKRHYYYTWSTHNNEEVTGSASGVDKRAWFANSFLVGFVPFETDSIWQPLATLALRKGYLLDHKLYGPTMQEIWQNSQQGFYNSRGDCEDHAIVLADWLIGLGHDARVVLGKHKNEGHAWVVLFKDGKEYVLEATDKRAPRSIADFQLAALATDYRPQSQFNRTEFWVNTGSTMTTRYRGQQWALRSRFKRANNN